MGVGVLRDDLQLLREVSEFGSIVSFEATKMVVNCVDLCPATLNGQIDI